MGRNVEIKARARDAAALRERVAALATAGPETIAQHDTFYPCARGRLKLRRLAGGGELIHYTRPDAAGPRASDYIVASCADPAALHQTLAGALGTLGDVRKRRELWRAGRTRIHLDAVEGLGDFLELEVALADGEGIDAGEREARRLMAALGVAESDLVPFAYLDLLAAGGVKA
ncbi:MAG: class IV adenylate cyclase [Candidatus Krumholzibacteriota bacterium]|nr:class IV adenylate cyclase [Candidatus Krumholzibacteriota bacterium]